METGQEKKYDVVHVWFLVSTIAYGPKKIEKYRFKGFGLLRHSENGPAYVKCQNWID